MSHKDMDFEKARAFDALALALTNQWHDGRWSWWCDSPPGGPPRATREEAVADLIEWAKRHKEKPAKTPARTPLPVSGSTSAETPGPCSGGAPP